MTYIKKLKMQGFKSFAKPTEVLFDDSLNTIVGPNGAGKSNISDAVCFVLGRLRKKSMRAELSTDFIYNGGKTNKPASEAFVEMVLDNSEKTFSTPTNEVSIARIVKKNGNNVYKINGETKTRQEILDVLAQADIDPYGFNIVLQGEIARLIQMHSEERRGIIEDVSGIRIYEIRKEKALGELEKTEGKLKEIKTILNERSNYLKNLEDERQQALKYQSLKSSIEIDKASITWHRINDRNKSIEKIESEIAEKQKIIEKITQKELGFRVKIKEIIEKITAIDQEIQNRTGIEQEKLRNNTLDLKTILAKLNVNKENLAEKIGNIGKRTNEITDQIKILEQELYVLENQPDEKSRPRKFSARLEKINEEIKQTKEKITEIESERDRYSITKSEISKKDFELSDRNEKLSELKKKISEINLKIESLSRNASSINIEEIRSKKSEHDKRLNDLKSEISILEKGIIGLLMKKEIHDKEISELLQLEKCPKCKQIITKEYKGMLAKELKEILEFTEKNISEKEKNKSKIEKEANNIATRLLEFVEHERKYLEIQSINREIHTRREDLEKLRKEEENLVSRISSIQEEIKELKQNLKSPESMEEIYIKEKSRLEKLQEDAMKVKLEKPVEDENFEIQITMKEQEIGKSELIIKRSKQEKLGFESELKELVKKISQREKELSYNEKDYQKIEEQFKQAIETKQKLQDNIHEYETLINEQQTSKVINETQANELKIDRARTNAELSTFEAEFKNSQIDETKILKMSIEVLEQRLRKNEETLQMLGSVNLRALEVYAEIKSEYDKIAEKVTTLENEKIEILKIVEEIDKKKRKTFLKTFEALNTKFSENFSKVNTKGQATLELENPNEPFTGGVEVNVKLAKGKYVNANLLSGGEKSLIALSLIFAIQDYKPYHFYIFDEIDAALDKKNSESLATLLRGNIKNAQYIIITHNDAMMSEAPILYGVTMPDKESGISNIYSLKL